MEKSKNTGFIFFAFLALLIMLGACGYHVWEYGNTVTSYAEYYGMSEASIREQMPFLQTVLPTLLETVFQWGLMSAVLFGFNGVCKRIAALKAVKCEVAAPMEQTFESTPPAFTQSNATSPTVKAEMEAEKESESGIMPVTPE